MPARGAVYGPGDRSRTSRPRVLVLEAVDRVLAAQSALLGLWEGAPSWHGATDRLRAALAPGPVGERASLG
ncbi:hypothetical protein [Streptomyces sp. NPDC001054]